LDIEIICHPLTAGHQLEDVLSHLAAPEVAKCDDGEFFTTRQSRMERWESLTLDLGGLNRRTSNSTNNDQDIAAFNSNQSFELIGGSVFSKFEDPSFHAPRLSTLKLKCIHCDFEAHDRFAPNLHTLVLDGVNMKWKLDFKRLQSLSIIGK
jgi:hypothetical protein